MDTKKSFGNPAVIDDIYLRNPVPPLDLLWGDSNSFASDDHGSSDDVGRLGVLRGPSRLSSSVPSSSPPDLGSRLIDLSDEALSIPASKHPSLNRFHSWSERNLSPFENEVGSTKALVKLSQIFHRQNQVHLLLYLPYSRPRSPRIRICDLKVYFLTTWPPHIAPY